MHRTPKKTRSGQMPYKKKPPSGSDSEGTVNQPDMSEHLEVQNQGAESISAQENPNPQMQFNFPPPQQAQAQNFIPPEQLQSILMLLQKVSLQQAAQNEKNMALENQIKEMRSEIANMRNASSMPPNETRFERGAELRSIQTTCNSDHRFSDDPYANLDPIHGRASIPSSPEAHIRSVQPRQQAVCDRVRIDKWCLRFDGRTGISVAEFIFRLETTRNQYQYPWAEIMRDFPILVQGDALKLYWKFVRHNPEMSWPKLKEALQHRFGSRKLDLDIWKEMTERKQGHKEKFVEFYDAILDLRDKLSNDLPDREVIKLIKQNATRFIRNMVYPQKIETVEELFEACIEVETAFSQYEEPKRTFPQQSQPKQRTAFAISEAGENVDRYEWTDDEEIAVVDVQRHKQNQQKRSTQKQQKQPQMPPPSYQCFNCKQIGHGFFNCPQPQKDIFCFKCGLPNHVLPQCPNCNQGNCEKSVKERANSRSTQTQTTQPNNVIQSQEK